MSPRATPPGSRRRNLQVSFTWVAIYKLKIILALENVPMLCQNWVTGGTRWLLWTQCLHGMKLSSSICGPNRNWTCIAYLKQKTAFKLAFSHISLREAITAKYTTEEDIAEMGLTLKVRSHLSQVSSTVFLQILISLRTRTELSLQRGSHWFYRLHPEKTWPIILRHRN